MATKTGLISFSNPFRCKEDILGEIKETTIAGVTVSIHFPKLPSFDKEKPEVGMNNPLLAPEIAKKWSRGDEPLIWGYPQNYPSGNSCVELLAVSVECDEEDSLEKGKALYAGIHMWGKLFVDYLKISTKQSVERDKNIENNENCQLEIRGMECIPGVTTARLYLTVPRPESFASKKQIEDALRFAASGKELHLEYQMLLSAYRARRDCQNRQAIIDACSAIELCLEDYISRRAKELGFSPDFLLDKFKSLGDRIDLAKQMDKSFPKEDHQAIIVKPRNDIAHNREAYPSDETTDQLIACVERSLQHYFTGYN